MGLTEWAWIALIAYAVHIMEEYMFDWRDWARAVIRLPVEWGDFYVTNSVVVVFGIAQGALAPTVPLVPLTFAALMIINATFFHVLPMIVTRGRWSPGVFTAAVLFYPVGIEVFRAASAEGTLTTGTLIGAFVIGALLMAYPIVMLHLRGLPYFRQTP
ncbi:HXXEE domain-containing protein [Bosea sp. 117]|uniref:HXXEE domain-containing protein n=1 Tax=Bosea sp. 117 TaxID=1125973 RepID=UPI00049440F0|nr:HXXEE domain-containing protein [Bosea sp. 117]